MSFEFSHYPLMPRPIIMWRWRQPAWTDSLSGNEGAADSRRGTSKKKKSKPMQWLCTLPPLSLINLQVVCSGLGEMIIVAAWWPCSQLGCLTLLTPLQSKAARLNDKAPTPSPPLHANYSHPTRLQTHPDLEPLVKLILIFLSLFSAAHWGAIS